MYTRGTIRTSETGGGYRRLLSGSQRPTRTQLRAIGWHSRNLGALGITAGQAVGMSAPIAGAVTTAGISSAAAGTTLGSFAGPIGAAVGAIVGVVAGLLAAHAARVKGAKNENAGVDSAVPTFDQAVKAIVAAFNSGQADALTCAQQIAQVDASMFQTLRALVGAPGTAWTAPAKSMTDASGATCNKSCTVGCCVYTDDLHPAAVLLYEAFLHFAGQGNLPQGDPRVSTSGNSVTIAVPEVFPGPFSSYTRPSYSVTLTPPPVASASASVSGAVAAATGISPTSTIAGIPTWLLLLAGGGLVLYEVL